MVESRTYLNSIPKSHNFLLGRGVELLFDSSIRQKQFLSIADQSLAEKAWKREAVSSYFEIYKSHLKINLPGRNFFSSSCNTNYARLSPSSVGNFKSTPHNLNISGAVKRVVVTPFLFGQEPCLKKPNNAMLRTLPFLLLYNNLNVVIWTFRWTDTLCGPNSFGSFKLGII